MRRGVARSPLKTGSTQCIFCEFFEIFCNFLRFLQIFDTFFSQLARLMRKFPYFACAFDAKITYLPFPSYPFCLIVIIGTPFLTQKSHQFFPILDNFSFNYRSITAREKMLVFMVEMGIMLMVLKLTDGQFERRSYVVLRMSYVEADSVGD